MGRCAPSCWGGWISPALTSQRRSFVSSYFCDFPKPITGQWHPLHTVIGQRAKVTKGVGFDLCSVSFLIVYTTLSFTICANNWVQHHEWLKACGYPHIYPSPPPSVWRPALHSPFRAVGPPLWSRLKILNQDMNLIKQSYSWLFL